MENIKKAAACRRFKFEVLKALCVFFLIDKMPWFNIKEPWNKLYNRTLNK